MIQAIIFDCFGVLVGRGFWAVYESLGGDAKKDAVFIDEWLNKADLGQVDSRGFSVKMAERLGITVEEYDEAFRKDEKPNKDTFDLIKNELVGNYKLALVSNATGNSVRKRIPKEQLDMFDEVLISGEVGILKPDPRLFELALNRMGVNAENCVFVDDHQEYIDGAEKVGMKTVLFHNVDRLRSKLSEMN